MYLCIYISLNKKKIKGGSKGVSEDPDGWSFGGPGNFKMIVNSTHLKFDYKHSFKYFKNVHICLEKQSKTGAKFFEPAIH